MKKTILVFVSVLIGASSVLAYEGEALESEVKINSVKAQGIAHKAFKGVIIEQRLGRSWYGFGDLTYFFILKNGKNLQEVEVDAMSGEVIENEAID